METISLTVRMSPAEIKSRSLRKALVESYFPRMGLGAEEMTYLESGAPVLSSGRGISLSHKNEKLFVLVSRNPNLHVGCDLELLDQKVSWDLFEKHHFLGEEIAALKKSKDSSEHFKKLALFSMKEALFKSLPSAPSGQRPPVVLLKKEEGFRTSWEVPGFVGEFVTDRTAAWIYSSSVWGD